MSGIIVCFGEALGRLSTGSDKKPFGFADVLDLHIGGAELNVAAGLAGLGHHTRLVTALPENPLGDRAMTHLRAFGVDTRAVVRGQGRMGLYFVATGATLAPSRVTYDRAHSLFTTYDWTRYNWGQVLVDAAVLHVSGITLALGAWARSATFRAMRAARKAGVLVSFDGNFRPALWAGRETEGAAAFAGALALADLAFVDHRDAAMVLGSDRMGSDGVRALFGAFPQLNGIAHTLRRIESTGVHHLTACYLSRDGADGVTDEVRVPDIVDRIGGGDAFAAGVLHGLLGGQEPGDIARAGLAAACLKHGQPGDSLTASSADLADVFAPLDVRR